MDDAFDALTSNEKSLKEKKEATDKILESTKTNKQESLEERKKRL
jgi:hypothetical protein